MKLVKENIEFERGQEPSEAMGIGVWKDREDIIISLEEFKKNGGILEKGREIYRRNSPDPGVSGYWLRFSEPGNINLMYNNSFKSKPINFNAGVKVKTKVIYK